MLNDTQRILSAIAEVTKAVVGAHGAVTEAQEFNHAQHQRTRALIRERCDRLDDQYAVILANLQRIATPIIHNVLVVVSGQSINVPGLRAFQGETDMSTYSGIPRDHQDEPFNLSPLVFSDSEGPVEGITATETLESDNPGVVSIVGEAPNRSFHFGTFGTATVSRKATFTPPRGVETTVNVGSAVFNLTPGALTVSGEIVVPGLTPDA